MFTKAVRGYPCLSSMVRGPKAAAAPKKAAVNLEPGVLMVKNTDTERVSGDNAS